MQKCIHSGRLGEFMDYSEFNEFMNGFKDVENATWRDDTNNTHIERHYHLDKVTVRYIQFYMSDKGVFKYISRINLFGNEEDINRLENKIKGKLEKTRFKLNI